MFPDKQNGTNPLLRFSVINSDAMGSVTYNMDGWELFHEDISFNGDYEYRIYINRENELGVVIKIVEEGWKE